MKQPDGKWLALLSMAASGIVLMVMFFFSEGFTGGGDSVRHYFLASFGLDHPENFLNLWGRPFYTVLTFPCAQLGMKGIIGFQIILVLLTAWLAYLIMKTVQAKYVYLVPFFVIFILVYSEAIFSAVPEVLFGFLMVFASYLFYRKQYILSAVTFSFLPYTRLEGMILLPVIGIAFLVFKQWKSIPFLVTGTLIFTFIGGFCFQDFLWIIHQFPYFTHHPEYFRISGSLFHFITPFPYVFGLPLSILFIMGAVFVFFRLWPGHSIYLFRKNITESKHPEKERNAQQFLLLIVLPALIYFGLHTYLFWQGKGGSIGLARVMAAIAPLIGITAFWGYQGMVDRFVTISWQKLALHLLMLVLIFRANFLVNDFPVNHGVEEQMIRKATSWLEETRYADREIFYTTLYVPYFLEIDPYDTMRGRLLWNSNRDAPFPEETISFLPGTIIFWDAHFGHNESCIPIDSLMKLSALRLLNRFAHMPPRPTMGGIPYEIYIFEMNPPGKHSYNYQIRDSLELARLRSEKEYLDAVKTPIQDITDKKTDLIVEISLYLFPRVDFLKNQIKLVVSLESTSRPYFYWSHDFRESPAALNHWNSYNFRVQLPDIRSGTDYLRVYLWNIGKQGLFVDDFRVGLYMP